MLFHAEILARADEGALERILRVLRHRGYSTRSLRATSDQEQSLLRIEIEGESERPLQHLARQIEKLYEVIEVTVAAWGRDLPGFEEHSVPMISGRVAYASASRG